MSQLPGDSIQINRDYLDSLLVEGRIVGAVKPRTELTFCGRTFDTPIMTAALSHIDLKGMAEGARRAGAAVSVGMGDNETLGDVLSTGAGTIKIIKPYADPDEIMSRLAFAEAHGAMGVGMDVEHAVNVEDAEDSVVLGIPMKLPTLDELRRYVRATRLPFFIKGALSLRDALTARDLGCAGVILSHHNGLMRFAVPPAMLLPKLRAALGDSLTLIADGGIASGYDAFKCLALGAHAVSVGRPLMEPLKERGAEGVREVLAAMTGQLKAMMVRTGSADLKSIDPEVIWPGQPSAGNI